TQGFAVVAFERRGEHGRGDAVGREGAAGGERGDVIFYRDVVGVHRWLIDEPIDGDVTRVIALESEEALAVEREVPARIVERGEAELSGGRERVGSEKVVGFRSVAAVEVGLENGGGGWWVVEEATPEFVEEPLALEGPFPSDGIFSGGEVIECGDVAFGADKVAADVIGVGVERDVLADEIGDAPAQREEVLVARHPGDFVILRTWREVGVAEFAAVDLHEFWRGVRVRPVELHLDPDGTGETVAELFH